MKQIIQDLKVGNTILEEVPAPLVKAGQVLIQTTRSLVSLGTERMLVEFGKANFLEKARQQPDKVKEVLNKVKTDGLQPTINAVFNKLGQPLPLGYCNVGKVIAIGKGVEDFAVGDRVASNGAHAEYVSVPKNLAAKIPDNVSDEAAAFTVIGAIGLQGIRLANPTFGETVVVVGLGLIGLITSQLLKANGCQVIGFDYDPAKVALAKTFGIHAVNPGEGTDQVAFVNNFTHEVGADAVIITASNKSNEIISQSAKMSRKRGRIILVGVIGLDLSRADFFEKELTFQVSCSYGPGRYDESYEQKGQDYPLGYVRWTEKRNFEAVLNAISTKAIQTEPLITERIPLENYQQIYGDMAGSKSIASILVYPEKSGEPQRSVSIGSNSFTPGKGTVGIIGAGNFTSAMILPCLKKTSAKLKFVSSSGGLSGTTLAKKFGISNSTTDNTLILNDPEIDLVMVTTRHNAHARLVIEALKAGKHVFVEKPLALNKEELEQVINAYKESGKTISVGFNRRFAPLAIQMKKALGSGNTPMNIIATMNAGFIPAKVWVHDMEIGGGRIIGEACHFIDLITYLSGSKVKAVCMNAMGANPEENTDNATILLKYENGTNGVINYFSNGSKAYSKERVEVYHQERTLIMDNWRKLNGFGFKNFSSASSGQDKGHQTQFNLLIESVQKSGHAMIPMEELVNTTKASFAAIESLKTGAWVTIG
ncbi:bi-domain-containing oxidoreductase [Algoriphagus sp.]|uniref:bi-domain-containing oxidoreductase n=1 Tax=Algoriphagus sp. TaxID=1872435 RepID=UPI0027206987|nr:bi-domain-containing oxidoreductase [Algoriphagus sp.]MDO8965694.1 bi-domain-containing oxidoreductase [Algoriphagus sp.]MDP3202387.1 bi-domain-containing oxidoreductase [Algoriphagus sp.]